MSNKVVIHINDLQIDLPLGNVWVYPVLPPPNPKLIYPVPHSEITHTHYVLIKVDGDWIRNKADDFLLILIELEQSGK